jgi:uncharacterized protein DUF3473
MKILGTRLPAAGGAYFRIFPAAFTRLALRNCERRGIPGTFYIHPWELDAAQPRIRASPWTLLRHYHGLSRTEQRLRVLMRNFRFRPISATLAAFEFGDGARAVTEPPFADSRPGSRKVELLSRR